jgi:hypothetical protein
MSAFASNGMGLLQLRGSVASGAVACHSPEVLPRPRGAK